MDLSQITPLILTFNEQDNLRRSLERLSWATQIVIVDSGSTDETISIASEFPNSTVHIRPFNNHTDQWNFGLAHVDTPWVLTLDADYICSPELASEFVALDATKDVYYSRFRYCVFGHELRGSLYPPRAVLFKSGSRKFVPDGHTQTLDILGASTGDLDAFILHDDHKPLSRWCSSQVKYAILEAEKLESKDAASLGWKDRIRSMMIIAPVLTFFYCLFAKRLILDGWPGIFYTMQRVFAELTLSLVLLEKKLRS